MPTKLQKTVTARVVIYLVKKVSCRLVRADRMIEWIVS